MTCLPLARAAVFLALLTAAAPAGQVVFSEVMYAPPPGKPEFLEVWNIAMTPLDIAKWKFTEGITFNFPDFNAADTSAHILKHGERILMSSVDEAATRAAYPSIPATVRIFGPWTGSLNNAGEKITLDDKNGVHACSLTYSDSNPWPRAADGTGHSLVLADENREVDNWRYWRASTENGGSPGAQDPDPVPVTLALSEVHFNTENKVDWVELRNAASVPASTDGFFLATQSNLSDKVPLAGPMAAGAYFSQATAFAAEADGSVTLYLCDSANRVRETLRAKHTGGRNALQRFPADSNEWYQSLTDSRDAANNPARQTGIVINEIMADTPGNQREGEFIELYNSTAAAISLSGWKLNDAVKYTFPAGTSIPAGGYLVVAGNSVWLKSAYPGLQPLGDWSGSLANSGERIRLEDADSNLADEVDYRFGGEWPDLAGGDGSSLELVNAAMDNSKGGAWRSSDESAKSTFQPFTIEGGTYRRQSHGSVDDEIRLWLVGDGHLILRNLVLQTAAGGPNLLVNGDVTTLLNNNVAGWQSRGTHYASFSDGEGVHIVADGHGDNKCNHMEKSATGMTANQAYRLTGEARWVYGKARLIAQTFDTTWGATTLIPTPQNLGTPGAVNSRQAAQPSALVTAGMHSPPVPRTADDVTITARVTSAAPLTAVVLKHRRDNIKADAVWADLAMNDAGTNGDVTAGDGIYTVKIAAGTISGYNTNGTIVQFYVQATADNGSTGVFPRDGAEAPGMWVVDNQNAAQDLRRMKVIVSAYWLDALNTSSSTGGHTVKFNYKFPRLSNHYYPCVFIHNDSEIYYGATVRKTGSPWTRGTDNSLDRARVDLPGDHQFRGNSKLYWDNDGNGGSMLHNRIHRYWLYLFGVNGVQNEVCRVSRNNVAYTVRESSEVFDKDMLDRLWENGSDGYYYEVDDKFWIGDDGSTRLDSIDGTWDYNPPNSPGAENPVTYQNNYIPKSRETEYDFSQLTEWFKQIETRATTMTREEMERMIDIQQFAAYAAVRGYSADWDNFTMSRGKNGFLYNRSTDHRWVPMHWDSDLSFQTNQLGAPAVGSLTNIGTFYGRPFVRRYLNYYYTKMIGDFSPTAPRLTAWRAAEEAVSTGYSVPSTYVTWANSNRPNLIRSFISTASLNAAFALTNPPADVTTNTVDLTGNAPAAGYEIICVGHPEAVFSWSGTTVATAMRWSATGIQLSQGANILTFRMLDDNGLPVGNDVMVTVNKTGNSPPVMVLKSDPSSQNAALGRTVLLDAGATTDPENAGPLSFAWTVTPAAGWSLAASTLSTRTLLFSRPGSYTVTVQATDANGQNSSKSLDLTVYSESDFDSFSGDYLTGYTLRDLKLLDNYASEAWCTLHEISNQLLIQISDTDAHPLTTSSPGFPRVLRSVPARTDFMLQTDLTLAGRQFGSFLTGLYLETTESGVSSQYAFGLLNGSSISVWSATGTGAYASLASAAFTGGSPALRIRRSGDSLLFQQRTDGIWQTVHTVSLAAGSTASTGGLFSATTAAQGVRTAFDYLLLSDPSQENGLVENLRISEIMYHPAEGGVEFLELGNFGEHPLDLTGVYFDDGNPFDRFTFGAITLLPGDYVTLTQDTALFQTLYGKTVILAGQYTGSLNNSGERVLLKDPHGNTIQDFTYGSTPPWPAGPDGAGYSLVPVSVRSDYNDSGNWQQSDRINGNPGSGNSADSDGDGQSDSLELAFGTDPHDASSRFAITSFTVNAQGQPVLTWPGALGVSYQIEASPSLSDGNWTTVGTIPGTAPVTSFTDTSVDLPTRRFYRIAGTVR